MCEVFVSVKGVLVSESEFDTCESVVFAISTPKTRKTIWVRLKPNERLAHTSEYAHLFKGNVHRIHLKGHHRFVQLTFLATSLPTLFWRFFSSSRTLTLFFLEVDEKFNSLNIVCPRDNVLKKMSLNICDGFWNAFGCLLNCVLQMPKSDN